MAKNNDKENLYMKREIVFLSVTTALLGLAPGLRAADQKKSAADDTLTVTFDVAMDASSARASRADWSITGPIRGDPFVSGGLVYPGGSTPDGDTTATFAPSDDSR